MLKKNQDLIKRLLMSVILTGAILLIVLLAGGYAPFGDRSLAVMDAKIQYLDFFSFLKDVFEGKNNIFYSFSKMLGGSYFPVFSYYLASPFNILVLFFKKENFIVLFHLLIVIKIIMSAITFSIFLYYRFKGRLGCFISMLLSAGFALSQYNLAQASNLMWLDGVYLLPLILLGVYRVVQKNKGTLLTITVTVSLLFNWYTGCINCLFSALWLIYELLLSKRTKIIDVFKFSTKYACSMFLGILMSSFLFLPTVISLMSGRGNANWEILSANMIGNPLSILTNYKLGGVSDAYSVSFYVGSLAILGFVMFLFSSKIGMRIKVITIGFSVVGVLMYYWMPVYFLFSLLKSVTSYWSRYSYLGCFFILFVSAFYFATETKEKFEITLIASTVFIIIAKLVACKFVGSEVDEESIITFLFIFVIAVLIYARRKLQITNVKKVFSILLVMVSALDLLLNTHLVFAQYSDENGYKYADYVEKEKRNAINIQNYDNGEYRISDLYPRGVDEETNLRANYNEAAAFGYWSLSSYDSSPNDIQRLFLDRLGYRINGENMCIINTSILPVDSLLGVKYILSDYKINGLQEVEEIPIVNNKKVYVNKYALPMAFIYNKSNYSETNTRLSPFEYINNLYSQISGSEEEIFKKVNFQKSIDNSSVNFKLEIPTDKNLAVYGNIVWNYENYGKLYINNEFITNYSQWLSPSVFYIGNQTTSETTVRFDTQYSNDGIKEAQFYYVDLDLLDEITNNISSRAVDKVTIKNGMISCVTEGKKGQYLFLSVPYDKGWEIKLNGKNIKPELFGQCLITIPLTEGKNQIEMKYHVSGLNLGILLTVIGVVGLAVLLFNSRQNNKRRKMTSIHNIL